MGVIFGSEDAPGVRKRLPLLLILELAPYCIFDEAASLSTTREAIHFFNQVFRQDYMCSHVLRPKTSHTYDNAANRKVLTVEDLPEQLLPVPLAQFVRLSQVDPSRLPV